MNSPSEQYYEIEVYGKCDKTSHFEEIFYGDCIL